MIGVPLAWGCGGGSDASPGTSTAGGYTKSCARTTCDTCREQVSSNCRECTRVCSRSSAYSGCAADCSDLCRSTCSACSGPERCEQWQIDLPPLEPNLEVFERCLRARRACRPGEDHLATCQYSAQLMNLRLIERLECVASHGCTVDAGCAATQIPPGAAGTKFCDRSASCGVPCLEGEALHLNTLEPTLRPEVEHSLKQCLAELTCVDFRMCSEALRPLWLP